VGLRLQHPLFARVVGLDEIEENEFNLNIPRYVDTFDGRR
jgi:type I restriction-modification system DNA methylase subunit